MAILSGRGLLRQIESKWRLAAVTATTKTQNIVKPPNDSLFTAPRYILSMFPYPSGNLHMGHVRVYSISDCLARFKKLGSSRTNVIHPMGWDSFGLPAENAAMAAGIQPADWTDRNISQMRSQLINLGFDFDWQAELRTSQPDYYKWTQWLFIKMYERGWAYRKEAPVSWDPVDCTVLAAEQVDSQGRSWRSGVRVETRMLFQWYLKITDFAEDLISGLDALEWPESIKEMQRNWIGRSEGCTIKFPFQDGNGDLTVFTTNPEMLFNVQSIAVSSKNAQDGQLFVLNPVTGAKIPITIDSSQEDDEAVMRFPGEMEDDNNTVVESLTSEQVNDLFRRGIAQKSIKYRMRDWLISRQRAWGTPIPMISCPKHGAQALNLNELPLHLPSRIDYTKRDKELVASPLANDQQWMNSCTCPICGGPAQRESDTMDTFVDSSWYFLRFLDPQNTQIPFNPSILQTAAMQNKPIVDRYIGGIEHAILHLLYARFITKVFGEFYGVGRSVEPFRSLLAQGLVQGLTRRCSQTGRYLKPDETVDPQNQQITLSWEKMSKSKFNGVEPQKLIDDYGSDCLRMAILFKAPPAVSLNWDDHDLIGQERFLSRLLTQLYTTENEPVVDDDAQWTPQMFSVAQLFNDTLEHIKRDMEDSTCPSFNVHIAMLMKLSNQLIDASAAGALNPQFKWTCLTKFAALLSPYAPCTATELSHICLKSSSSSSSAAVSLSSHPLDPIPIPQNVLDVFTAKTTLDVYLNGKELGKATFLSHTSTDNHSKRLEDEARLAFPQLSTIEKTFIVNTKRKLMINFVQTKILQ